MALAAFLGAVSLDFTLLQRVTLVLVATLVGGYLIVRMSTVPEHDHDVANVAPAESYEERKKTVLERASKLSTSDAELQLFAFLLLFPEVARKRVVEQMDLTANPISRSAWIDLRIPLEMRDKASVAYVPVVRPIKGQHVAQLEAHDENSSRMRTLNHEESVHLIVRLAEELLRKAFNVGSRPLPDSVGAIMSSFVEILLRVPDERTATTDERTSIRADAITKVTHVAKVDPAVWGSLEGPHSMGVWSLFCGLTGFVSCNYVLVGIHEPQELMSFGYRYRVARRFGESVRMRQRDHLARSFFNWLRRLARGLARSESSRVRISVNKGNSCDSYHLSVKVAEGNFVGAITLLGANTSPISRPRRPTYDISRGYFRVLGKGSSTAHLYARGLIACRTANEPRSPGAAHLEMSVFETPPGAMGRAVVVSAVVVMVAYLAGTRAETAGSGSLNIDALALIGGTAALALVLVSFVIGHTRSDPSRVIALLAVVSALASVAILLFASGLLVSGYATPTTGSLSFLHIRSASWVACCLAALTNFVLSSAALAIRVRRFDRLTDRETRLVDADAVEDFVVDSSGGVIR